MKKHAYDFTLFIFPLLYIQKNTKKNIRLKKGFSWWFNVTTEILTLLSYCHVSVIFRF